MSTLSYNAGDALTVSGIVTDTSGAGVDLTGAQSAVWVMWARRDGSLVAQDVATPGDQAVPGTISYASTSVLATPGLYEGQFRVVTAAGDQVTWPASPYLIVVGESPNGTSIPQPPGFQPASVADLASYTSRRLQLIRESVRDVAVAMEASSVQPTLTLSAPGVGSNLTSQIAGAVLHMVNGDASEAGQALRVLGGYDMAYGTSGIDVTQIRPRHLTGDAVGFPGYTITFGMAGDTEFGMKFKQTPNISFRLWIDDRLVTTYTSVGAGMTGYAEGEVQFSGLSGRLYEVLVSGLDSGAHTYRLEVTGGLWFGGIYTGPITSLYRVKRPALRAVLLSDSTGAGANSPGTGGGSQVSVWWRRCCDLMGWEYYNASIGGTGIVTAGPAVAFGDRVAADVASIAPDVVVVSGSRNDHGSTLADVQAGAAALYAQISAALPHALLLAVGPWTGTSRTSDYLDANTGTRQAALAGGVPFVDMNSGIVYDQAGNQIIQGSEWVTGTGKYDATAGDGNADWVMGTDAVHPTLAGHAWWARRAATSFRAIIDALPAGALV